MGSRSGDVDPAILTHVMIREELAPSEVNALLNKHSGLLGLSGLSNDMRALLEAEAKGNERARLAIDVFCYRLRKYLGPTRPSWAAWTDWLSRGASARTRPRCGRAPSRGSTAWAFAWTPSATKRPAGAEAEISPGRRRARVFVIPTNEEIVIARDTCRIVAGEPS